MADAQENVVPPPPHIALAGFTSASPSQRSPRRPLTSPRALKHPAPTSTPSPRLQRIRNTARDTCTHGDTWWRGDRSYCCCSPFSTDTRCHLARLRPPLRRRFIRFPPPIAHDPPRSKTQNRQSRRHRTSPALCPLYDQVACCPPPAAREIAAGKQRDVADPELSTLPEYGRVEASVSWSILKARVPGQIDTQPKVATSPMTQSLGSPPPPEQERTSCTAACKLFKTSSIGHYPGDYDTTECAPRRSAAFLLYHPPRTRVTAMPIALPTLHSTVFPPRHPPTAKIPLAFF
ncbi:hypothetical protein GGX14DRAFT_564246 [Mycena pura]|uniref:Uncharacterized protein n=1 Tax=Mycena pura TaxID=153505 RepID=A0AAD6VKH6_9AGAR|nr:hypothetical protein GGX14DRAFT_564246 [Mycena pura]